MTQPYKKRRVASISMTATPVAHIEFLGGIMRPVYEDEAGQYVYDDDGESRRTITFHRSLSSPCLPTEGDSFVLNQSAHE
jgi:hypothetical protein